MYDLGCLTKIDIFSIFIGLLTIIATEFMEFLNLFLNNSHLLIIFFGTVFGGFIALFAFLGFVVTEKTKDLVEKILFNRSYINLSETADKEYKLWVYVKTFNPEILKSIDWKEMKGLIKDVLYTGEKDANGEKKLSYEGEYYKNAFYRFKNITKNFISFFWTTVFLLFISLASLFLMPLSDVYCIKLVIGLFAIIVFLLSLFALTFAALVVKSLFIAPKKVVEKLKKEISEE